MISRLSPPAIAMLTAGAAYSQEAPPPADDEEPLASEEIVVTGSRIKRQDFVSISPIATVDAEDITFDGITSIEDLVNYLPQLMPNLDRTGNNPGNGAAELDLRGLGPGRTLVMLNGRRAAPHNVFGAVDVNNIPAALVQRVEVITGGASAVYGSDAVSGVVNFILDTDFTGAEFSAQHDFYEAGDGEVFDANLSLGGNFAEARGHVMGFMNFQDRNSVFAGDREFTHVALQEDFDTPTGEIVESGSPAVPGGAIFTPPTDLPGIGITDVIIFDPDGSARPAMDPEDLYNFQPDNYLQIPQRRRLAGLFGDFALTPGTTLFTELIYSRSDTDRELAPAPIFSFLSTNVDHPSLTPGQQNLAANNWDADGDGIADFFIGRRFSELGPRQLSNSSDSLRALAGLEGQFGYNWDWEAAYTYSETDKEVRQQNGVAAARLQQALFADPVTGACLDPAGGCVPVSLFGDGSISVEDAEFLRADDIASSEVVQERIASFNTTGQVLDLPAGPLAVAAGIEWRDLAGEFVSDPELIGEGVLGFPSESGVDGSFEVKEIYAEALVPLLSGARVAEHLSLETGLRFSDYSLSGGAWNWKLGLDWGLLEGLRVRAMQQRATRAPNINELFREPFEFEFDSLGFLADECSASRDPVARGVADLCIAQGIPAAEIGSFEAADLFPTTVFDNGGNTDLVPERADTLTLGVVIEPRAIPELSLTIDYYRIEIDNSIGAVSADTAVALCFDSNDIDSAFCRGILRGPSGNIVEVTNPQFNLALSKASGIDVIIDYRADLPARLGLGGNDASLAVELFGTRAIDSGHQGSPASPFVDCAGWFGGLCAGAVDGNFIVPDMRTNTRLTYYSGPVAISLNWEWIDGLENNIEVANAVQGTDFASELDTAGSRNYVQLSARYRTSERIEIYGGVSNLFKEQPPLLGFGATQSNTAPQLYDVFGRRYFLGLRYGWP